jgi:hypothetical protein
MRQDDDQYTETTVVNLHGFPCTIPYHTTYSTVPHRSVRVTYRTVRAERAEGRTDNYSMVDTVTLFGNGVTFPPPGQTPGILVLVTFDGMYGDRPYDCKEYSYVVSETIEKTFAFGTLFSSWNVSNYHHGTPTPRPQGLESYRQW